MAQWSLLFSPAGFLHDRRAGTAVRNRPREEKKIEDAATPLQINKRTRRQQQQQKQQQHRLSVGYGDSFGPVSVLVALLSVGGAKVSRRKKRNRNSDAARSSSSSVTAAGAKQRQQQQQQQWPTLATHGQSLQPLLFLRG